MVVRLRKSVVAKRNRRRRRREKKSEGRNDVFLYAPLGFFFSNFVL
jgi:hypothetical protein